MRIGAPPVADEQSGLLAFLAQQRRVIKAAAHGLTSEQLRAAPSASALTMGGLLKHVASVELGWMETVRGLPSTRSQNGYEADFLLSDEDTLTSLVAGYDAVAADTERLVTEIDDLDHPVPVPDEPWFPKDGTTWTLRWVLLHVIEETARHAGHADIVRESIDGATTFELLAAAEDWEPTPWITPWRPKEQA
jgi:uncharacterized damage-inducible protein DinB